jgi:uncharacterized membrane protein YedE/YeeE
MTPKKYMNPYLAGFFLGLVLLATIFITGRGLGASGAIKSVVVAAVHGVAPAHAEASSFFGTYVGPDKDHPLKAWLVFEVAGVIIGGFISGLISDRLKFTTESGPRIRTRTRWFFAAVGGALFGIGAQMARGCTSGAALSGMAVLSTAGFIAMMAIFGTGYAAAYAARHLWLEGKR